MNSCDKKRKSGEGSPEPFGDTDGLFSEKGDACMDDSASCIRQAGVIGIVRLSESKGTLDAVRALEEGGLRCVEITMTTPKALQSIEAVANEMGSILVGAGTVLDGASAQAAIQAGARYLVTPTVEPDVIEVAQRYGVCTIVGAMTPTEILTAWELGADMVKVFPADCLGPEYLKAVHGPLPQIPLVPTGGITADNAGRFIEMGAAVVCAGGWLVDNKAIAEKRYDVLTTRAKQLLAAVEAARARIGQGVTSAARADSS